MRGLDKGTIIAIFVLVLCLLIFFLILIDVFNFDITNLIPL